MKPSRFTAGVYDWDADVVGRPSGDRWQQLGGDTPGAASESFPMVILVLTAEIYPNALLLQRRTPANSSSGFDLLANVSGRLHSSDCRLAGGVLPELPERAWRLAAVRELWEECRIDLEDGDLEHVADLFETIKAGNAYIRVFRASLTRQLAQVPHPAAWLAERCLAACTDEAILEDVRSGRCNEILERRYLSLFRGLMPGEAGRVV